MEMKNFENNTSIRDVINAINQIIRQKSNVANQPAHSESATKGTQPNRTGTTIHFTQNIIVYENPLESTKWFLLVVTIILLGAFWAFSSGRRLE